MTQNIDIKLKNLDAKEIDSLKKQVVEAESSGDIEEVERLTALLSHIRMLKNKKGN